MGPKSLGLAKLQGPDKSAAKVAAVPKEVSLKMNGKRVFVWSDLVGMQSNKKKILHTVGNVLK